MQGLSDTATAAQSTITWLSSPPSSADRPATVGVKLRSVQPCMSQVVFVWLLKWCVLVGLRYTSTTPASSTPGRQQVKYSSFVGPVAWMWHPQTYPCCGPAAYLCPHPLLVAFSSPSGVHCKHTFKLVFCQAFLEHCRFDFEHGVCRS